MCLIVDANAASLVFGASPPKGWVGVGSAILEGRARMVVGGRLTQELQRVEGSRRVMLQLQRAGKLETVDEQALVADVSRVESLEPRSNDAHVLALARVSGARLLVSDDDALQDDFKDRRFLQDPRGKVCNPRTRDPARLLRESRCPPRP